MDCDNISLLMDEIPKNSGMCKLKFILEFVRVHAVIKRAFHHIKYAKMLLFLFI